MTTAKAKKPREISVENLKIRLQKSLEEFGYTMLLCSVVLFCTLVFGYDYWTWGILPTLIIYSLIGSYIVITTIQKLTKIDYVQKTIVWEDLDPSFAGAAGVNKLFYAILPLMWAFVYLIGMMNGTPILSSANIVSPVLSIVVFIILFYDAFRVISELSFIIFFVNVIFARTEDAKTTTKKSKDSKLPEGFDAAASMSKLSKKYSERIAWYEKHLNEENHIEYVAKIETYKVMLRDIEDIKEGIN